MTVSCLRLSESESYITTNGQSASLSWNKAPGWGLRPDFYYHQTVAGLLMWGVLPDERTGLSFTIVPDPRQRSHFEARALWDSWKYFTVSDSRLPFSSLPTTRRVTVEVFDPASTRESNSSGKLLPFYNLERTEYISPCRTVNSALLFSRCHGNAFVNILCAETGVLFLAN
jgi:hypothetical protein